MKSSVRLGPIPPRFSLQSFIAGTGGRSHYQFATVQPNSLARFDVTGISGPATGARLRLWVTDPSSNGPEVYASQTGWNEDTLTWNTRPSSTGGLLADVGSVSAGTFVDCDVSALVTGNGTWSFVLRADSTDGADFHSRENTNPPQLIITTPG